MSRAVIMRITCFAIVLIALSAPLAWASEDQPLLPPVELSLEPKIVAQSEPAQSEPAQSEPVLSLEPVSNLILASAGSKDSDDFRVSVNLGLWATSLNGTVGVRRFNADVNESFSELIKDVDLGAMGGIELRKGNWLIAIDGVYAKVTADESFRDGRGVAVSSNIGLAELALGYTVIHTKFPNDLSISVTPAVGVRWTYLEMEVNPDRFPSRSRNTEWWDPFIGGRVVLGLTDKLDLRIDGSVGGLEILGGSQCTWGAAGYFDWQFCPTIALNIGYRALFQDYENGNFRWDMLMHGPWIGLTFDLN